MSAELYVLAVSAGEHLSRRAGSQDQPIDVRVIEQMKPWVGADWIQESERRVLARPSHHVEIERRDSLTGIWLADICNRSEPNVSSGAVEIGLQSTRLQIERRESPQWTATAPVRQGWFGILDTVDEGGEVGP
jgi:hypothetical protein